MRNRVPLPDLDRGKKETVGQKTCGGNHCPNIMPLPHNESRTVHNRHESASSANASGLDQAKMGLQTACLVVNPIKVNSFAYLFNCTTVGRTSD